MVKLRKYKNFLDLTYMILMKSEIVYDSEDYDRIAQAIAFMRQHHLSQPDLATVAQHIGLSEYHFQRLFTQWAGISRANFFVGDTHMGQGDAELSGTAIEASMNAYLQIFVLKDFPITNPILETDTHWITHGFNEDLNKAMRQSAEQMLSFLQNKRKMSADEAYSLISVAVDFGVTQVVDIRQGCHAALAKSLFLPNSES